MGGFNPHFSHISLNDLSQIQICIVKSQPQSIHSRAVRLHDLLLLLWTFLNRLGLFFNWFGIRLGFLFSLFLLARRCKLGSLLCFLFNGLISFGYKQEDEAQQTKTRKDSYDNRYNFFTQNISPSICIIKNYEENNK